VPRDHKDCLGRLETVAVLVMLAHLVWLDWLDPRERPAPRVHKAPRVQ